ncbi:ataxin-7-like protein 1 isoform X2 [Heptranchias perlo]|uniref:ataxin-7-like protein 1 isoform X2 n=1 Tax=Heptranchias perlo TaxID=212740 RepID=UPI00355A45E3
MMAAPERRLPSPEAFVGQSWSNWIERAEALRLSDGTESEDSGKDVRKKIETMRLIRDERRHGSLNKLSARKAPALNSPSSIILQKSRYNSVQTAVTSNHGTRSSKEKLQSPGNKVPLLDVPSKGPKENLCLFLPVVNLEKIPSLGKAESSCIKLTSKPPATSPSSPDPTLAPAGDSTGKTGAESAIPKVTVPPPPTPVVQNGKGDRSPVLEEPTLSNRRNSHKVYRRVTEKECDLNKHCGVMDPETKKPCTRSLTCKTHSLTQRRGVFGRRLAFDQLLAEHRASLKNKESGKERKQQAKEGAPPSPVPEAASGGCGLVKLGASPSRTKVTSCPGSRVTLESELTDCERVAADPTPHAEPHYPLFRFEINSRLSSEESEGEITEESEKPDCHHSRLHPKPLAFCTFGSRMISRGCYVFNQRLDRFRSALNSMVEKHLNSQMWRKIPPASDPPRSPLAVPPSGPSVLSLQSGSPSMSCLSAAAASSSSSTSPSLPSPTPPLPSPSSGRTSWAATGRASGFHESPRSVVEASPGKRKKPAPSSEPPATDPPLKRNCVLSLGRISAPPPGGPAARPSHSNTSSHNANNGVVAHGPKAGRSGPTGILGHSGNSSKGAGRTAEHFDPKRDTRLCEGRRLGAPSPPPTTNSPARAEGRKRKNTACCSKPTKIAKSPEVNCVQRKREENLASTGPHSNSHTHKAKVRP